MVLIAVISHMRMENIREALYTTLSIRDVTTIMRPRGARSEA
jgi:hypothetical protein